MHVVYQHVRGRPLALVTLPADAASFPLELLLAPMLIFLVVAPLSYAWLGAAFPAAPGPDAAKGPDYAELLTNHVAMTAGGVASYVVLRIARALRPGARLRVLPDVVVPLLIALAICQTVLYFVRLLVVLIDPGHRFPTHAVIEALGRPDRPVWLPWAMWIGVTIIAPVAEELFFRGVLLTALLRTTRHPLATVLLGGLAFGLAHYQQPQEVPALALFGVILGLLYLRTRSLRAPILVHALFNAKTMLWLALGAPA